MGLPNYCQQNDFGPGMLITKKKTEFHYLCLIVYRAVYIPVGYLVYYIPTYLTLGFPCSPLYR